MRNARLDQLQARIKIGGRNINNLRYVDAATRSRQSCPTLCDPTDGSPPGSCPWDSPGKNIGGGCHFLLRYVDDTTLMAESEEELKSLLMRVKE